MKSLEENQVGLERTPLPHTCLCPPAVWGLFAGSLTKQHLGKESQPLGEDAEPSKVPKKRVHVRGFPCVPDGHSFVLPNP